MSTFEVLDAFSLLRRELGLLRANEMKTHDLGPKQMMLLYRLTLSNATMGELAEYTLSDKASATRAITSMEKAGLVKRIERKEDKRVTIIELTQKGKTKANKAIEVRAMLGQRVQGTLKASEQKNLAALLNKVALGLREQRLKV